MLFVCNNFLFHIIVSYHIHIYLSVLVRLQAERGTGAIRLLIKYVYVYRVNNYVCHKQSVVCIGLFVTEVM